MVSTPEGIHTARSVHRIPVEERWGEDSVRWVKWAPWNRYKGDEGADGEVPEGVEVEGSGEVKPEVTEKVYVEVKSKPPRDFYISKKDAEKHGYTRGCAGCSSWYRGLSRQPHSEVCRARFKDLLKSDAKVLNQEARKR